MQGLSKDIMPLFGKHYVLNGHFVFLNASQIVAWKNSLNKVSSNYTKQINACVYDMVKYYSKLVYQAHMCQNHIINVHLNDHELCLLTWRVKIDK